MRAGLHLAHVLVSKRLGGGHREVRENSRKGTTLLALTRGPLLNAALVEGRGVCPRGFPTQGLRARPSPSSPVPSIRTSRVPSVYGASKGRLGMEAYFHSDVMSALLTGLGQTISKV